MATYSSVKYNFTPPAATTSAQVGAGAMTLIKSIDSDGSDATISFVDGASSVVLDSTYKTYIFKYISIHPETTGAFQVNFSIDGGSNYNVTKTTTSFRTHHSEADDASGLGYDDDTDLAQSTSFVAIAHYTGNDGDQCASGELWLFNPSNTTFVKHFISRSSFVHGNDMASDEFVAGYGNTTSAIDAIQFKMASDEIQGGTINMYGIA